MEEGLQIPVSFTLEEAREALKQLEKAAREAGKKIGDGLDPGGGGKKNGLDELRSGMSKGRQAAMMFTSALQEFGPQGVTFQRLVSGAAGAFLGGGGLLFALEAARFAASLYADSQAEAAKSAEEFLAKVTTAAEAAAGRLRNVQDDLLRAREGEAAVLKKRQEEELKLAGVEANHAQVALNNAWFFTKEEERRLKVAVERYEFLKKEHAEEQKALEDAAAITVAKEALAVWRSALDEEARLKSERDQKIAETTLKYGKEAQPLIVAIAAETDRQITALREKAELEFWQFAIGKRGEMEGKVREAAELTAKQWTTAFAAEREKSGSQEFFGSQFLTIPPLTDYEQAAHDSRVKMLHDEDAAAEQLRDRLRSVRDELASDTFRQFASAAVGEFGKVMTSSAAYERAMKKATGTTVQGADLSAAALAKFAQDALASTAQRAAVEAIMELAFGLRDTAMGLPTAAAHFASAKMFGIAAAAAGLAAIGIGQGRGMTSAERASARSGEPSPEGPSSGAREVGASSGRISGTNTREVVIIVGDPFETPQETARRASRRLQLAKDLDMDRRV